MKPKFLMFLLPLVLSSSGFVQAAAELPDNCIANPSILSKLSNCATGTAFCTSVLGHAPRTKTKTVIETATLPLSTFGYTKLYTSTTRTTTTAPTQTITSTYVSCLPRTNGTLSVAPTARIAVAAGESCGVAGKKPIAISQACDCYIDRNVTITKTVMTTYGTMLAMTRVTTTTSTTSIIYLATTTVTSTLLTDNCYPPAAAACPDAQTCGYDFLTQYRCGSNHYYDCYCGADSFGNATCWFGAVDCYSMPKCSKNWDCDDGEFCLYGGCCPEPRCMKYDSCSDPLTY